jgi:hypothetical protein
MVTMSEVERHENVTAAVRWSKICAGVYQAEGTSVQVIKREDVAECWEVTYLVEGIRHHAQQRPTMREARDAALGFVQRELADFVCTGDHPARVEP